MIVVLFEASAVLWGMLKHSEASEQHDCSNCICETLRPLRLANPTCTFYNSSLKLYGSVSLFFIHSKSVADLNQHYNSNSKP